MNHKPRLFKALRVTFCIAATWSLATGAAHAQGNRPKIVYGKILLYMQPGTPRATVDGLAGQIGAAKVKFLSLRDCYEITLPVAEATEKGTLDAVAKIKASVNVRSVKGMPAFYHQEVKLEPNDPRYLSGEQWNLKMMNLPQAWAISKGGTGVNVAVIDNGFLPDHEDLTGQYVIPGSKNFAEGASDDPTVYDVPVNSTVPFGAAEGNAHGTHVSGSIVAKTNNGKGIAGVCWENIKCIGLQCTVTGDDTGTLDGGAIIQSMNYVATNKILLNIGAVNMSFGGYRGPGGAQNGDDPEFVACKSMADAGVICVAAAGNSYPFPNTDFIPAGFSFCTTIGSVGPSGQKAYYSQTPKVDISAPGGDQLNRLEDGILSSVPPNQNIQPGYLRNVYEFYQGTSMASPNACGVIALALSLPGVQPAQALQTIKDTANRGGLSVVPDPALGYGRVDAYKALLALTVNVHVVNPNGVNDQGVPSSLPGVVPPLETYKPLVRLKINQVTPDNLTLTIDGQAATLTPNVSDPTKPNWDLTLPGGTVITNVVVGDTSTPSPSYSIVFPAKFTPGATPGSIDDRHTIVLSGTNPDSGITRSDTRIFTIIPHTLSGVAIPDASGTVRHLAMISIPFMEAAGDSPTGVVRDVKDLLRPDVALYRYVYLGSGTNTVPGYASFNTANDQHPEYAKLYFTGATSSVDGSSDPTKTDIRPVGASWFADLPDTVTVKSFGKEFGDQPIRIPITEGWNMIGDPYNYPVPFTTVLLEDKKGDRVSVGDAIAQNKMLGLIYRYDGANGYVYDQLPDANLQPWQGHWIYIRPQHGSAVNLNNTYFLLVQPTNLNSIGRAAKLQTTRATTTRPSGKPVVAITGPNSWALQLKAQVGSVRDANNFVGMTSVAVNEKQLTRVPKPPMPASYISVGVTNPNTPGILYSEDIQATGGARTWDVVVATDQLNTDVSLAANFVGTLPRNYRVTLTDKVTGQMVDLRNTRSYHYNSGKATPTRNFIITARPTTLGQRAIMSAVFVNPSRSTDGRAVSAYEIGYNLSQDANVEVAIMSASGRQIAVVGATRAVSSGDNRAVWSGRDNAGRAVPAGTYMVQIKAVTTEGEITRVAQPLLVTGR